MTCLVLYWKLILTTLEHARVVNNRASLQNVRASYEQECALLSGDCDPMASADVSRLQSSTFRRCCGNFCNICFAPYPVYEGLYNS